MEVRAADGNECRRYHMELTKMLYELLNADSDGDMYSLEHCEKKSAELQQYLDDNQAVFIGAFDDGIVGFIWAFIQTKNKQRRLHLNYLFVKEEYRRQKVATLLMSHLEEYARENKVQGVELFVNASNQNAIEFYLKHNFKKERMQLYKQI